MKGTIFFFVLNCIALVYCSDSDVISDQRAVLQKIVETLFDNEDLMPAGNMIADDKEEKAKSLADQIQGTALRCVHSEEGGKEACKESLKSLFKELEGCHTGTVTNMAVSNLGEGDDQGSSDVDQESSDSEKSLTDEEKKCLQYTMIAGLNSRFQGSNSETDCKKECNKESGCEYFEDSESVEWKEMHDKLKELVEKTDDSKQPKYEKLQLLKDIFDRDDEEISSASGYAPKKWVSLAFFSLLHLHFEQKLFY
eukprot:g37.t1